MNLSITREHLQKSLKLHGVPDIEIDKLLEVSGVFKDFADVKFLLDSTEYLDDVKKQCIIDTCYQLMKITFYFKID